MSFLECAQQLLAWLGSNSKNLPILILHSVWPQSTFVKVCYLTGCVEAQRTDPSW